jgi:hypothetical protein
LSRAARAHSSSSDSPGGPPNSDIMFGGPGNDVNLWAPCDGGEALIGGPGLDATIFGATDREALADPSTGVLGGSAGSQSRHSERSGHILGHSHQLGMSSDVCRLGCMCERCE